MASGMLATLVEYQTTIERKVRTRSGRSWRVAAGAVLVRIEVAPCRAARRSARPCGARRPRGRAGAIISSPSLTRSASSGAWLAPTRVLADGGARGRGGPCGRAAREQGPQRGGAARVAAAPVRGGARRGAAGGGRPAGAGGWRVVAFWDSGGHLRAQSVCDCTSISSHPPSLLSTRPVAPLAGCRTPRRRCTRRCARRRRWGASWVWMLWR
jgi:hypothetical protein